MRTTAAFAILCLAIGVAPSFASSSRSASPNIIRRSGRGYGREHPKYWEEFKVHRAYLLGVPRDVQHIDPADLPTHPGYQKQFKLHPGKLQIPFKYWNTDPAEFQTHPNFEKELGHHPGQLGFPLRDWRFDPTTWHFHPEYYIRYRAHPGQYGIHRDKWGMNPLGVRFPPPPAQGRIQPEPREQTSPPGNGANGV
ncbi:hypothetical protein F5148DRAFT_1180462 [Russula earlei]|uniref:Uncharacterized protein n=1 Tax=Russula earlei TaxID=71964 RepID=A0ACC0UFL1_9AGAM|nr:hypothetical protein F5148DRAFT_1180462 [Russula earlei]